MPNPVAAIDRMEEAYFAQDYAQRPTPTEVSTVSCAILDHVLGDEGTAHIVKHPRVHTNIVTARGRGPAGAVSKSVLGAGMGSAALSNTLHRRLLAAHFQRVVFYSGDKPQTQLPLEHFNNHFVSLGEDNLSRALHASGSIPFVLNGERNIPRGPLGQYWDGGIIDYHFDLSAHRSSDLILYPHFSSQVITGWFDKFLPWRKALIEKFHNVVLLCPSDAFIASLPLKKIPDRSDFQRMKYAERNTYWRACVDSSAALAEDFSALINSHDPLAGTTIFE